MASVLQSCQGCRSTCRVDVRPFCAYKNESDSRSRLRVKCSDLCRLLLPKQEKEEWVMQNAGQGVPARRNPRTIEGKARPMPNAGHQKALNEYQTALQWMHEGKYEKARLVFEKLSQEGPVES